jgi:hypothetical protein
LRGRTSVSQPPPGRTRHGDPVRAREHDPVRTRIVNRARAGTLAVFAGILVAHVWFANVFPRLREPNTMSRLYLALAIAEDGRFEVDAQVARHGRVEDLATRDGHFYSDKAPGASFLLAPIAWFLRATAVPVDPDPSAILIALRLLGVSLPTVLFWIATRSFWAEQAGDAQRGLAVLLAGALGTPFFVYATLLYPHVQAGMLAFVAFLLVRNAAAIDAQDPRGARMRVAVAGFCLALASITDYIVLLVVPVLSAYAVWCRSGGSAARLAVLCAGALLPAMAGAFYHDTCFGSPFALGFHHEADPHYRAAYATGFFGIQPPTARALFGVTLGSQRGVFHLAPVLLLAPFGFARALTRPGARAETAAAIGSVAGILLFAITTLDWTSGWAFGCRYLVPAIPFLLVGVAAAVRDAGPRTAVSILFRGLACVGFATTALAAASFPFFPREFEAPVWQLALPLLLHGHVMPSLLAGSGFVAALLPFAALVAAAAAFVLLRSWPLRGAIAPVLASFALAAITLFAMQRAAPPAASDAHQAALGVVFRVIGR